MYSSDTKKECPKIRDSDAFQWRMHIQKFAIVTPFNEEERECLKIRDSDAFQGREEYPKIRDSDAFLCREQRGC